MKQLYVSHKVRQVTIASDIPIVAAWQITWGPEVQCLSEVGILRVIC